MINADRSPEKVYLPNPTNAERHELLKSSLVKAGRPEDFENIVELLSPPPDITTYAPPGSFKNKRVAIVGGGSAGMAAAFELRKLGFDITIFEAENRRIGGRIYTHYFDRERKLYGEFGAMRIPVSHEISWHYINLFKLNTIPFIQTDPNAFFYIRGVRVRRDPEGKNMVQKIYPQFELTQRERDTPWPKLYDQVADHFLGTLTPEIRKQFLMILPEYSPQYEAIMNISERQALAMFGLSTEAIHLVMSAMPITGALSDSSYETSLNEGYSMDFSNLYRIDGGMVNLPISFYRSLTSRYPKEYGDIPQGALGKVTWMGGSYVLGVHEANDNKGIVLAYRKGTVSEILYDSFDYAISAVPMSLLREAYIRPRFSGRKMEAISRIRYVDAQKTLLLCSERFWEKQGIKGGSSATDEIIQMIAYPSDHAFCNPDTTGCSPEDPGVLLASYNFLQDAIRLGNALPVIRFRLINRLVEEVHGLPEDYLRSRVLAAKTVDWNREMWAQGAFCYFLAGQKKDFLYVSTMPEYNNRVFFAGEHASTKNAWIQGALQSGMLAANNLAYHAVRQRR